jgi:hypothetical protein
LALSAAACGRSPLVAGSASGTLDDGTYLSDDGTSQVPACTDTTQLSLAQSPHALDVIADDARVYWAVTDGIWSVPLEGGAVAQLITGELQPTAIAADKDDVYFAAMNPVDGTSRMGRVNKAGGPVEILWSDTFVRPAGIALDADTIYWVRGDGWSEGDDRSAILSMPKAGGEAHTLAFDQSGALALAVDDEKVYWLNAGQMDDYGAGELHSISKKGGPAYVLATHQKNQDWTQTSSPKAVAVDATNVYWALSDGFLRKVPKTGGAVATLAFGGPPGLSVAIDETHLYWTAAAYQSTGYGNVARVRLDGGSAGAPEVLATEIYLPYGICLARSHIVWTSGYESAVSDVMARCK